MPAAQPCQLDVEIHASVCRRLYSEGATLLFTALEQQRGLVFPDSNGLRVRGFTFATSGTVDQFISGGPGTDIQISNNTFDHAGCVASMSPYLTYKHEGNYIFNGNQVTTSSALTFERQTTDINQTLTVTNNLIDNINPALVRVFGLAATHISRGLNLVFTGNQIKTRIPRQDDNSASSINMIGLPETQHSVIDNNLIAFADEVCSQKTLAGDTLHPVYYGAAQGAARITSGAIVYKENAQRTGPALLPETDRANWLFKLGSQVLKDGLWAVARGCFRSCIHHYGDCMEARYNLALCELATGQPREALAHLAPLPDRAAVQAWYAELQHSSRHYHLAIMHQTLGFCGVIGGNLDDELHHASALTCVTINGAAVNI